MSKVRQVRPNSHRPRVIFEICISIKTQLASDDADQRLQILLIYLKQLNCHHPGADILREAARAEIRIRMFKRPSIQQPKINTIAIIAFSIVMATAGSVAVFNTLVDGLVDNSSKLRLYRVKAHQREDLDSATLDLIRVTASLDREKQNFARAMQLFAVGDTLLKNNKPRQAIDHFEQAITEYRAQIRGKQLEPKDAEHIGIGYCAIARCYEQMNDPHKSIIFVSKAIELNPRRAKFYSARSLLYKSVGNKQLAASDDSLVKSLTVAPGEAQSVLLDTLQMER